MTYCCCICRETISEKRKKDQNVGKIRPVVTTKCGHLFHPECLNKAFSRNGNEAWATKECPVCKMSLCVATDLIRIFPTGNAFEEEQVGPSAEDLQEQVKKYGSQILELRNLLESSFLRNRETEKAVNQLKKENEALVNTKNQLTNSKLEYKSRIEGLSMENAQLKNTVVSLSKNLAHMDGAMQFGRMNLHGMGPYARPPGLPMPPFRPYLYPNNNMYYQRWPAPSHPMNISPTKSTLERVGSVDNLLLSQERPSKAVSMSHLNILHDEVSNDNDQTIAASKIKNDVEQKISNGGECFTRGREKNKLSQQTEDNGETEISSSVDEFMNDLFQGNSSNGIPTKTRYDPHPMVGQGRVLVGGLKTHQATKQLYGKFYCDTCKAVWGSSRSFTNMPQFCRNCNTEVFPYEQCPLQTYAK